MIQLIEKIKVINKFHKQIAEISDEKFNMFRVCGVNHYENTHSSILCELLRNDSSHNFKDKFLEALIDTLKKDKVFSDDYEFSYSNVKVIPEHSTEHGRIDIFIKNDTQCIIIENKIYAADQFEQLKRYAKYATKTYNDKYEILYLTLWGSEASEQSSQGVNYKQISYETTIIRWIERCIEISARSPVIRETLIQYINHLKYLTNNTESTKMRNDIIELLSNGENIGAVFTIGEELNNVKNHLINKVLLPQLKEICEKLELDFKADEYDRVNTAYAQFVVLNPKWKSFKICFEFEAKGLRNLIVGINHKDNNLKNEDIFNKLKKNFSKSNDNWVWSDFPKYSNWGKEAMVAIGNGEMAELFKNEIEKILEMTEGLDM